MKYFFIIFYFFVLFSCQNAYENKRNELLFEGLKQTADYNENILNFYYENNIERLNVEYKKYYKQTAFKMRNVSKIYQPFDIIFTKKDSLNLSNEEIYKIYSSCIKNLNSTLSENDPFYKTLSFNTNFSEKELLIVYKNDLQNIKNQYLRNLIKKMPLSIQKKQYFVFQNLDYALKKYKDSLQISLFFNEIAPPYLHQIEVDSIVNKVFNSKSTFSLDTFNIWGAIHATVEKKGNYIIFGKAKIKSDNGYNLIPFQQHFVIY